MKEIKDALRSLGVTEHDILQCMEKSDLQELLETTLPAQKSVRTVTTAEDVESRLLKKKMQKRTGLDMLIDVTVGVKNVNESSSSQRRLIR